MTLTDQMQPVHRHPRGEDKTLKKYIYTHTHAYYSDSAKNTVILLSMPHENNVFISLENKNVISFHTC